MKIPTNKIVGWQKTKNCLPVLDAVSDDCTLTFRSWSDYGRDFDLKDIRKWAYIKL